MRCFFFLFLCFLLLNLPTHLRAIDLQSESHFGYFQQTQSSHGIKNIGGSGVMVDLLTPQGETWGLGLRTLAHGADDAKASLYRLGFGGLAYFNIFSQVTAKLGSLYYKENSEQYSNRKGAQNQKADGQGFAVFLDLVRYINLYKGIDFGFGTTALWTHGSIKQDHAADHGTSHQRALTQGLSASLKVLL